MTQDQSIRSDMRSQQQESQSRPRNELGFYLVASNRELLNHVENLMNRKGIFGIMDSSGRVHYLVDGRRGSPYAAKIIMTATGDLIEDQLRQEYTHQNRIREAVDSVITRFDFNIHLRGYRLLIDMMRMVANDISLLNPISKRLYPLIAERYRLTAYQVERNVRYLLEDLASRELVARANHDTEFEKLLFPDETRLPVARSINRLAELIAEQIDHKKAHDLH